MGWSLNYIFLTTEPKRQIVEKWNYLSVFWGEMGAQSLNKGPKAPSDVTMTVYFLFFVHFTAVKWSQPTDSWRQCSSRKPLLCHSADLQDFGFAFAAWIVIESLRIWSIDSRHNALPRSTKASCSSRAHCVLKSVSTPAVTAFSVNQTAFTFHII